MKVATTARRSNVILLWTFIVVCGGIEPEPTLPPARLDDLPIYLFADALLSNRNYFEFFAFGANGPPVFRASGHPVFGAPGVASQLKGYGEFDVRLVSGRRGEKRNRPSQGIFSLRPPFDVPARVFGHEFLRDTAVIEIADGKSVIF